MLPNTLPKEQRLKLKRTINKLFEVGQGGFVYPVRYVMIREDAEGSGEVAVMVSVSKRNHKRANVRNLLKRRLRESYRLNKGELRMFCSARGENISLGLLYSSNDILDYKCIEDAVKKIVHKLSTGS